MKNYKIIDAHSHIFPQKIASKAVKSIGEFYDLPMTGEGTAELLLESGKLINVEKYLVCSTATKPEQVVAINDFIFDECNKHSEFIGFATLHPEMDDIEAEFERIMERGFRGIKLHPDFQAFNIDDNKAEKIYHLAQGKLFILFHTGDPRHDYSRPKRLANVCHKFPDLKCIAAHFGGYQAWDEAYEVYDSKNIFMDTSSSLFHLSEEKALSFIEKFGAEQFFYGTDFPMWTHKAELDRFLSLNLSDDVKQQILYHSFNNAVLK